MKKNKLVLLILLANILQLSLAQNKLPEIRSNSKTLDIRDGDDFKKGFWGISPQIKPDIYMASGKKVTFYTDKDSITFESKTGLETYNFVILLNGKDSAYTQVKFPKVIVDNEFDTGSGIKQISLNKQNISDLQQLGLIWGFLKYYHPSVAAGNYNWDYELFRILPKFIAAKTKNERDNILCNWIKKLGSLEQSTDYQNEKHNIKIKPDLDWIKNIKTTNSLVDLLTDIKNAKRTGINSYVNLNTGARNPDFNSEKPYNEMGYPDAGFRLLSLFRYWNIIQYYFPYKNLIGEDWKNVLTEFIPKFINANSELTYKLTVQELIARIKDAHAEIWDNKHVLFKYWGINFAPLRIRFINNKAIVTDYTNLELGEKTGLKIGDEIISINNKTVKEIVKERLKYIPEPNVSTQLRDIGTDLLRTNDSILNITYIQEKLPQTKIIHTSSISKLNVYGNYQIPDTCFKMINPKIAYINNEFLKRKYLPDLWKEIQKTNGLIIDNRNYPSDFPLYNLCSYLVPDSTSFVKFTYSSVSQPGFFEFTKSLKVGGQRRDIYKGKVIILVNETSQSLSEFCTMAYRVIPNALVIGSTTAGADGNVSQFFLPGGITTFITGIGVYYPNGKETQRYGIIPDIIVKPNIESIKQKKDVVLEKAIELIEKK
jgi:hypothetical protein